MTCAEGLDRSADEDRVHLVHLVGLAESAQQRDRQLPSEMLSKLLQAAQHVERPVLDDPQEPGLETGILPQIRQAAERLDEAILDHVECVLFAADDAECHPKRQAAVRLEQIVLGLTISVLGTPHEMQFRLSDVWDDHPIQDNPRILRPGEKPGSAAVFLLMRVEYENIEGILLMTYRKYTKSDWEANVINDAWVEEITKDIKFNQNLDRALFNN